MKMAADGTLDVPADPDGVLRGFSIGIDLLGRSLTTVWGVACTKERGGTGLPLSPSSFLPRSVCSTILFRNPGSKKGGVAVSARAPLGRRLIDLLDLPPDVILDLPKISLIGDYQLSLENHRGLIEYNPDLVRVSTNRGKIRVRGVDLSIKSILKEELLLTGQILGIELVDWGVN